MKKLQYNGDSKILLRICSAINDLIDSGGKHLIVDASDTEFTPREKLKFMGNVEVLDNSQSNATIVKVKASLPDGGTTGQFLVKNSNTDYDVKWLTGDFVSSNELSTAIGGVEDDLSNAVNTLQSNFQDGVDDIYYACVSKGSTPASHSLADVVNGILNIPQGGGGGEVVLAGIVEIIPKQTKGDIGVGDIVTFL